MGPIDALLHVLNFFAPALGVGVLASMVVKLLWRRELASVSWRRMSLWASACGAMALLGGLLTFGRDGKMVTYGAMVLVSALALWGVGFGFRRR